MSMHGGGGGGGGGRMGLRSMRTDRNILEHQIKKGRFPGYSLTRSSIARYSSSFSSPSFSTPVVSSSLRCYLPPSSTSASSTNTRAWLSVSRCGAGLAIFDAILSLFERRTSAVIGEGLIYDLRAKVFSHIQEMPIAFFSRTQTGASDQSLEQ